MIKLHQTISRTVVDEPQVIEDGRLMKNAVTHEETTPLSREDRGAGGTVRTVVEVDGPVNAEFTQEEAKEVAEALVLGYKLSPNNPGRRRRIERTLLRLGLDPADLAVFDD